MGKTFNKEPHLSTIRELQAKLEDETRIVDEQADAIMNDLSDTFTQRLAPYIEARRAIVEKLGLAVVTVREEVESYMDGRSQRWLDGDTGQAFGDLHDALETAESTFDNDDSSPVRDMQVEALDGDSITEAEAVADALEALP